MRLLSIAFLACLWTSSLSAQTAAGTKRENPKDGLTYVWIQPGSFSMGCSEGDSECYDVEKPAHTVAITTGFWIGQTEVTQAAYRRVTGSYPSKSEANSIMQEKTMPKPKVDPTLPPPPPPPPRQVFRGPSLPAESVTWDEAREYCSAVGMRLPTEAEWEYAARGGRQAARYAPLDAMAWYWDNTRSSTHPVAQKKPNGYGLYDTVGNVSEWVTDWYDEKHFTSAPATDPRGPASGEQRAVRGGSWLVEAQSARVTFRHGQDPANHGSDVGFRCVANEFPRP